MDDGGTRARARGRIERGLRELGGPVSPEVITTLVELAVLVARWAARLNLTGHKGIEAIIDGLVLEAAALETALPPADSIADIGAGAGFPGLPLAILRPRTRLTLVESRERRHHFQRHAIRELGIANATALRGRAEDLSASPHALAIAQASARPAEALPWLQRWTAPGGWLAIPGGASAPEIPSSADLCGVEVRSYHVPPSGRPRTVWLARRRQAASEASGGCR